MSHTLTAAAISLVAVGCASAASLQPEQPRPSIEVIVLGSGTPVPNPAQYGPAILVRAGGTDLLFDAGRGLTSRLAQRDPRFVVSIDTVFFTHLHSDHVTGFPDLWLNGWAQGRSGPVSVYGPVGTKRMIGGLRQAFAQDIDARLAFGAPEDERGLVVTTTEFPVNGLSAAIDGVSVTAFPVEHGPMSAFGYRIEYGGYSVVISGDTTMAPSLTSAAKDADLLLLEVLSPQMLGYLERTFSEDMFHRIVSLHLTTDQAVELLRETSPSLGVFYHTVVTPESKAALLEAAERQHSGRVAVATDLTRIRISGGGICFSDGAAAAGSEDAWDCDASNPSVRSERE